MAETIGRAYVKILADGTGMGRSIEREMRKAAKNADKGGEDYADRWGDGFDRGIQKQRQDIMKSVDKAFVDVDERGRVLGKGFGANFGKELERRIKQKFPELEKSAGNLGERMAKAFLSDFAATGDTDFDFGRRLQVAMRDIEQEEDRLHGKTTKLERVFASLGNTIGRSFGKGSRNNFLNFVGTVIGGFAELPGHVISAGRKVQDFMSSLGEVFEEQKNAFMGFIAVSGRLVPAIGAALIGLPVFIGLVGTATTALLLMAGAVAALASSLAFGLIGALAPLVGLLGPIGLVAGGVATAFIGMSDAAKKSVKEAFAPLKSEFKALGDAARPGILDGLTEGAKNLEEPMKRLEPLFKVVGDSIGEFMKVSSRIAFGPGFAAFVDTMTKTLPSTMHSLGVIVGNTFDGLFGLFATLQPVTTRFLDSLERISGAFADWSVSPEASRFFERAATSAGKLVDFLGAVWNLLSTIVSAGKDAGDSLFGSMTKNIQGWTDALKANPDLLDTFFKDAKKMGEAVGTVVEQIGHLIDALDTDTTRKWAISFIGFIGDMIGALADLISWWDKLPDSIQKFTIAIGLAMIAWGPFSRALTSGAFATFISNMTSAETRMIALAGAAKTAAGMAGLAGLGLALTDAADKGSSFENVLGGIASGAATGFALGGPIGALIGGAAGGGLTALAGAFNDSKDAAEKLRDEIAKPITAKIDSTAVENLVELLAKAHGNYKQIAADAAGQAVEQAAGGLEKLMQAASLTGLRKGTIADAFAGDPEAIRLVTNAMGELNNKVQIGGSLVNTFSDAVTETNFGHLVDGAGAAEKEISDLNTAYDTGLIGAKQLAEGTQLLTDALDDGVISGKEFGQIQDFNRGIVDQLSTNIGRQRDALQTLTNITGDAAQAQSILNQNNQEGARLLGITVDQLHKLPKKVQTDIGLNGAPETTRQAVKLLGEFGKFLKFKDIRAVVSAPGIDLTRAQIKRLADQAKLTPKQIRILLKTEGANKAGRDLDGVKKKADDASKKEPKVKIKADSSDFDTTLSHIKGQMSNIPKQTAKAKFDADPSAFNTKSQAMKTKMNALNSTTVSPKVTLENSAAMTGIANTTSALNNIPRDVYSTIHVNTVRTGGKATAAGGIFNGAQTRLIGEAGPEAVVPLARPLSLVDPAVRELSAIAQGMRLAGRQPVTNQKTIDVGGITIITPTKDPGAVAQEAINRLVAVGY